MALLCVVATMAGCGMGAAQKAVGKTILLPNANNVTMPSINLGTCCGSDPSVGLGPWLAAGGTGIDTAFDYRDQVAIGKVLAMPSSPPREKLFITTKVPAGFGNGTDCYDPANLAQIAYNYVLEDVRELGVKYVDLALVHHPCGPGARAPSKDPDGVASNNALWEGMQRALKDGLTRAIGISNFNAKQIQAMDTSKAMPAVNQCQMGIDHHDDETISYCQSKGIVYESYDALKGCPTKDADVVSIAAAHNVSTYQLCLRWVLERGCIIAAGTGSDPSTVGAYAKENLNIYDFTLSAAEMAKLNSK